MFDALTDREWMALALSLKVGVWSVIVSLPVAFAIAWLLARVKFPGKTLIDALVHLPLVMPPVVTGYLLLLALGRRGPVGMWLENWFGVTVAFKWEGAVIAAAVMALPLIVRPIRLSLEAIDRRLEVAGRSLGGNPLTVFLTITLPLAMPGVLAGAILGFARGLGEFGATITFVSNIPGETQTLPIAIYSFLQVPGAEGQVARLVVVSIAISLAALIGAAWVERAFFQHGKHHEI